MRVGKIVSAFARLADSHGKKLAPVDHAEMALLIVDDNYTSDFRITRRVRKSTRVSDKAVAQRIANHPSATAIDQEFHQVACGSSPVEVESAFRRSKAESRYRPQARTPDVTARGVALAGRRD